MKRLIPLLFFLITTTPVQSEITQTLQSVVSVKVDAAYSESTRLGSSITISGNNVTPTSGDTAGALGTLNLGSLTNGVPAIEGDTTFAVTNAGDAFTVTETYLEGDAVPTVLSTTVTNGSVPSLPILGSNTTYAGGNAGDLAGTLDSGGTMAVVAGNSGTTATMQSTITIEID